MDALVSSAAMASKSQQSQSRMTSHVRVVCVSDCSPAALVAVVALAPNARNGSCAAALSHRIMPRMAVQIIFFGNK